MKSGMGGLLRYIAIGSIGFMALLVGASALLAGINSLWDEVVALRETLTEYALALPLGAQLSIAAGAVVLILVSLRRIVGGNRGR